MQKSKQKVTNIVSLVKIADKASMCIQSSKQIRVVNALENVF